VIAAAPGLSFWAGNRFYDRHDIHINDFFFFDTSGVGGGFEGLKAGPGKLAVAFMGGASDAGDAPVIGLGKRTKKQIDFRYRGIELPDHSRLSLWTDLVFESPSMAGGDTVFGLDLGVMHEKNVLGGFNKAMVQYGRGSGMYFNSYLGGGESNKDKWMLRVTELLQGQLAPRLSLMGTAIYQYIDNTNDNTEQWISLGVRPIYAFTNYLSLASELGIDNTRQGASDADSVSLAKITVAPQISTGPTFWARPTLRAFATLAFWNDAGKGKIGSENGQGYAQDTMGLSFGVQLESWW
jgi:maltoporin